MRYLEKLRKDKKAEKPPLTGDLKYSFSENFGSIIRKALMMAAEAVVRMCSVKKVFLEISQNSQENTCARASF